MGVDNPYQLNPTKAEMKKHQKGKTNHIYIATSVFTPYFFLKGFNQKYYGSSNIFLEKRLLSVKELMYATESGNLEALKEIVNENPRWQDIKRWISLIDKKGRTPLHLASLNGHSHIARFIFTQLDDAIVDKDLKRKYVNLLDKKGRTSLFHAAAGGHTYVLRCLSDIGVKLDTATNDNHSAPGSTAIMASAEKGHLDCFNLLLEKGADLLATRKDGADAFYLAAMKGNLGIVDSIVNTGHMRILCHHITDKPTYRGRTPLSTAAFHGHLKVVKFLFEHGSNLNHQDSDKFSPLSLASYGGHLDMVKWLLKNGADPLKRDKFGDTALESSDICGHVKVAKFIENWLNSDQCTNNYKESIVPKKNKSSKSLASRSKSKLLANTK